MPIAETGSRPAQRDSVQFRRARALAAHADRYFGAISWGELRALGYSSSTISRMVERGELHQIGPRVYAIGHRHLTPEGWWSAAVRVGDEDTLLSHRAATAVRGLLRAVSHTDIIVSRQQGLALDYVRPHCCVVDPLDRDVVHGLPVTSLPRTLMDLAGTEPWRLVEALEQSLILGDYDHAAMLDVIDRHRGHRGVARLRAAIAVLPDDPAQFRSRSERRARELLVAAGLPEPEINAWYVVGAGGGHELDLYWRDLGRNVEIDGPRHDLPWQKTKDRYRDADLRRCGLQVQRHRVEVLDRTPHHFVAAVAAFLAEAG